jgi:hypothetical protein
MRRTFAKRSLPLLHLLVCLFLTVAAWPQAQPKPASSPTPNATAPATTSGPCSADYYRNSDGACVHRPVKSNGSTAPQGATGPMPGWELFIQSASTRNMFASRRGSEVAIVHAGRTSLYGKRPEILRQLPIFFLFLVLCSCSSETLGYVDKAKFDDSQKEIADMKKQLADTQEKLAASQKSVADYQAHKYQMFQSGFRTWRLDTATGDSCIALTTDSDWKSKKTKGQSCSCTDLFVDSATPNETVRKIYCGW